MQNTIYAALISLFVSPAWADMPKDMPKRKSGLWDLSFQLGAGAAPMRMQQCVDEKSDDLMQQQSQHQTQAKCSKHTAEKSGNRIITDSVCKLGETTATTKAVFTGDFTSVYRGEIQSSFNPPMHGMKESKQIIDAKWLGPCKPGQKPGDVMMPGREKINPAEMMKNLPKPAGR